MAEVETNVALGTEAAVDDVQLAVEDYEPGTGTEPLAPESTVDSPLVAQPAASPDNGAQQTDEDDFTRRVGRIASNVRKQMSGTPEYQLGMSLLNDYTAKNNITREEAFNRIQREQIDAKATAYKNDPSQFYRDYLMEKQTPKTAPQTIDTNDPRQIAQRIGNEIESLYSSGQAPAGFTPDSVDDSFFKFAVKHGTEAALDFWQMSHAVNPVQTEVQRRQASPRPMSPPTGNNPSGGKVDFMNMSDAEFKKFDDAVQRMKMSGKRISFS